MLCCVLGDLEVCVFRESCAVTISSRRAIHRQNGGTRNDSSSGLLWLANYKGRLQQQGTSGMQW